MDQNDDGSYSDGDDHRDHRRHDADHHTLAPPRLW
ncbi:hypothetical protein ABIA39_007790 [Nocardia sp. GAS34]